MLETRNRVFAPTIGVAITALVLGGCSADQGGDPLPPPPTDVATAYFSIAAGRLPYPTDLFFAPSAAVPLSDGTLNLPTIAYRPASMQTALNALDGWSTTAPTDTSFSLPIDASSISASSIKVIKLYLDPRTKAPANPADVTQATAFLPTGATSPVKGILTYGTDFTAEVSSEPDSYGKILKITWLKPLEPSAGQAVNNLNPATTGKTFNIGYLVLLTDSLKATSGQAYGADTLYADIKAAPANCSTITDATQKQVCLLTKAHLGIAAATGTPAANVILSWSFSTQSQADTMLAVTGLAALDNATNPTRTRVVPAYNAALGRILTTKDANSGLFGKANIYTGSTVLPYYLTAPTTTNDAAARTAVLTKFWTAKFTAPPPLTDTASTTLTMFNPTPLKTVDVTVPLLITVPNTNSACPGMPVGGWPIAIVQHGITGNRSQALAMADAFADQCFIVASIDLPLHGITDTTSPLYCTPALPQCIGATERTFNVDLINNTTGAAVPDGKIDSSGAHFINLSSPLTGRDNVREAEADTIMLSKAIKTLAVAQAAPGSLPAGAVTINNARVHFTGLSLGSIVGGAAGRFAAADLRTLALSVPGGVITQLLNNSATFGPVISGGVSLQGLAPGNYLYNLYFRDFQAVIDSGDPVNHIKATQASLPTIMFKVLNDTVVPNSATDALISAGGFAKIKSTGNIPVAAGAGKYTFFKAGSHGTLFDPTASLPATMEMQAQAIGFAATAPLPGGPFVPVGTQDASVLDLQ